MLSMTGASLKAQDVDSIFFHLYTDSLKKGTFNYINVDGKLHNGSWLPLTGQQLLLSSSGGRFEGNSLFLDTAFQADSVLVKAVLRSDTVIAKSVTIWVKKINEVEHLKSKSEIMQEIDQPKRRRNESGKQLPPR